MPRLRLAPRKRPQQQRSQAMVETLLEAATRVLARDSLAGFTTNRVAEVAGVSVGSLYQYFPNKEALIAALIERAQSGLTEAVRQVAHAMTGATLDQTLTALVRLAIEQQYRRPLLAAALDHEERRLPIQARLREHAARLQAVVESVLERHAAEIDPACRPTAARDLLTITQALVEGDIGRPGGPSPDIESRVLRALRGYLRPGIAATPASAPKPACPPAPQPARARRPAVNPPRR